MVFPVFGGELKDGKFYAKEIYGTAFYLKHNLYITCGHTIKNASSGQTIALGFRNKNDIISFCPVIDTEIFENNDSE